MTNLTIYLLIVLFMMLIPVNGVGVNWGTDASHPLPPGITIEMALSSGFQKIKFYDVYLDILKTIGNRDSNVEVSVGIPNTMVHMFADSVGASQKWVQENVTHVMSFLKVNITGIVVGKEPNLDGSNGKLLLMALQNIQDAVVDAGLGDHVKVTVPFSSDVIFSPNGLPSQADFRSDIADQIISIVRVLAQHSSFMINVNPFMSLNLDPNFPIEYAFFDGGVSPIIDNGIEYFNIFEATLDGLLYALEKNGFYDMPIVVGEVGWPTDGHIQATVDNSQRFNKGLVSAISKGTPKFPRVIDTYILSLIDEDKKSVSQGAFERHWGLYYFDGVPKYDLDLGKGTLAQAKGVIYEDKRWCVLRPEINLDDPRIIPSVNYACAHADCTVTSCANLPPEDRISYALNSYYQNQDQDADVACDFKGIATVTRADPSTRACKFKIMFLTSQSWTVSVKWEVIIFICILSTILGIS